MASVVGLNKIRIIFDYQRIFHASHVDSFVFVAVKHLTCKTFVQMKYNESHFVSPYERKTLAEKLGITERAVIYWFQNRRRKDIKNLNNMNMGQPPPNV